MGWAGEEKAWIGLYGVDQVLNDIPTCKMGYYTFAEIGASPTSNMHLNGCGGEGSERAYWCEAVSKG